MEQRRRVANIYKDIIKNELDDYVSIQKVDSPENHVYWMNSIILTEKVKKERDVVMKEMEDNGIEMRPLFYPMHIMPPFEDKSVSFPVAERLSSRGINLPTHAGMDEDKIEYVISCLKKIIV